MACPSEAVYRVATFAAGAPESHQYFDALGREVQSSVRNFADTGFINVRTQYDERGQVVFESEPFDPGAGETGLLGTRYLGYDALGRLTAREQDQANGTVLATSYSYQGLTTSIDVNNASLLMHRIYNGLDQLVETQDAMGGYTRYAYDGAGNPIVMVDPNGHPIKARFNALGHKLWVDDPNMGLKSFTYNGVGEVLSEHDANSNTVHTGYDALGRMIERRVGSTVVGAWHYDNPAADKGLGLLDYEDSGPGLNGRGLEKHYYYSSAASGRKDLERVVHRFSVNTSSTDYEVRYYTDGYYGRPKGLRYPGGVGVAYHYNTAGYLVQEKDASSSYVIRQISARDSRNEVIAATLANGALSQSAAFYPATGQMHSIAVTGPGGSLHDLYYEYDGYGNLNYQTTTIGAVVSTEGFFYDALHRLTQSSRSYPSGSKTVNYAYDPSGNLTLKDDYATSYTYSTTTRPNAVVSITKVGGGSVTFSYDANGNLTSGDGKSLTYTAFNKPETITAGGITATFHYGADLARYRQEKTNGETTLYIDKLMEIVSVGASTDYRHYLGENAILTKIDSLSDPYPALTMVLRDRLGSVVTLTDETGANPERRGYDPFGKPRDGDWAEKTPPTIGSGTTDRGFTDHEHLDDSKLIHMNGRAYDYQLGRFLSVDPYIQEPGNSQSLNPYSYIMNNPLAGTDPSGYACQSKAAVGDCLKGLSAGQSEDIVNSDGGVIGSITKGQDGAFAIQRNNGVTGFFGANMQMIGAVDASGNGIDSIGSQHGGNGGDKKSEPGFFDLTVDAVKEGRGDILRDALEHTGDFLDEVTTVPGLGRHIVDATAGSIFEGLADASDGDMSPEQAIWLGIAIVSRGSAKAGKLADPSDIRFTQDSISTVFRDGRDVSDTIAGLRAGAISAHDIPPIRVFRMHGKEYTLDNRRLFVAIQAGTKVRTVPATPAEVARELPRKFTTVNDGCIVCLRSSPNK